MSDRQDDEIRDRSAAGPVAGSDDSSSQAAGESPDPTPPAEERSRGHAASPSPEQGAQHPPAAVAERSTREEIDDLKRERDEYLDLAQRTRADFENYRKRMAAETQAAVLRGKAELARELIGVIDNLERALAAAGIEPDAEQAEGTIEQGILLTYRELTSTLKRAGVESYDPAGERFDPNWHEALQTRPADGADPGTVVEVLQKGFRLDGQVLRAARVVVSE